MRAGLMDKRITLLRQVRNETELSFNEPVYEPAGEVWARVQHKSGTLEVSSDMLMNVPRVVFSVRDHVPVEYGMMIGYKSDRYAIIGIDDTSEKGVLRITAEARHEG